MKYNSLKIKKIYFHGNRTGLGLNHKSGQVMVQGVNHSWGG